MAALGATPKAELLTELFTWYGDGRERVGWLVSQLTTDITNADNWCDSRWETATGVASALSTAGQSQSGAAIQLFSYLIWQERDKQGIAQGSDLSSAQRDAIFIEITRKFSSDRISHSWTISDWRADVNAADDFISDTGEDTTAADQNEIYFHLSTQGRNEQHAIRQGLAWNVIRKRWEEGVT